MRRFSVLVPSGSWLLLVATLALLAGCTRFGAPAPAAPAAEAEAVASAAVPTPDDPAFGQRIVLPYGGSATLEARFRRGPGTPWEPLERFVQQPGQLIFELPAPGPLPAIDETYEDRGPVDVGFFAEGAPPSADPLTVRSYHPYGSVVAGELNVLTRLGGASDARTCARRTLRGLNRALDANRVRLAEGVRGSVAISERLGLCFVTIEIGANDTDAVLAQLEALPQVLAVGRNVVLDMDGGSVNAFDPTCDQTGNGGPVEVGSEGFTLLFPAAMRSSVGAEIAEANGVSGQGVTVAIVGGGVAPALLSRPGQIVGGRNLIDPGQPPVERFGCDYDGDGVLESLGHETHIAEIVSLLAPDASLLIAKTCTDEGICPSGKLGMALLALADLASGPLLVNVSAGSPLPDPVVEQVLSDDLASGTPRLVMVSTGGNHPKALRHSPGDLDIAAGGTLPNVIAVGSSGRTAPLTWAEAPFSNDIGQLLAPGVRLCPDSAAGPDCTGPDAPGKGGSSYAASFATGVLALYADMKTQAGVAFGPVELRTCIQNRTPDGTRPLFVYDATGGC